MFNIKDCLQTITQVHEQRLHPQIPLLTSSQFESELKQRGMSLWPKGLDHLTQNGLIYPIESDGSHFHPFQTWLIYHIFSLMRLDLAPQLLYEGFNWDLAYRNLLRKWDGLKSAVDKFLQRTDIQGFYRIFPLLLWLECYYLPTIRGSHPSELHFVGSDFDGWWRWRGQIKLDTWLKEFDINLEDIKWWHQRFSLAAYDLDPAPDWYLLRDFQEITYPD